MKRTQIFLILILFFGATFRLWGLSKIPEGFHADEAAFGYNAYSLLRTGKDEYGKSFPLVLRSFDDYKGAIYSYLTVPFVATFGLNEFSVRIPSAIAGTLIVFISFVLTLALTRSEFLSLATATVVSFSPSSILLSRVQSDPLVAVLIMLVGWYCIGKYVGSKKHIWAVCGLGFWMVSCFTYASPRVLLLGFIPLLFWYYLPQLDKKMKLVFAVIYMTILFTILCLMFGFSGSRFGQVNIFSSQDVMLPLNEQIREDGVAGSTIVSTRMYHNKIIDYGRYIFRNYANYFGSDFLFFQAYQPEREKIHNIGFMYLVDLPFLLIGLYQILKFKKRWGYFVFGWLLFTPLALAVFGQETPNIHRYYFSILPGSIMVAFGMIQSIKFFHKNIRLMVIVGIAVLYAVNISYFIHQLFVHQPLHMPYYRGFAYKEMVRSLQTIYKNYDKIVITKTNSSPYIYLLFYMGYNPKHYQELGSPRDYDYTGFDSYVFVPLDCPNVKYRKTIQEQYPDARVLYINKGGCIISSSSKLIQSIVWRDGTEAFQFVENISTESAINTPIL